MVKRDDILVFVPRFDRFEIFDIRIISIVSGQTAPFHFTTCTKFRRNYSILRRMIFTSVLKFIFALNLFIFERVVSQINFLSCFEHLLGRRSQLQLNVCRAEVSTIGISRHVDFASSAFKRPSGYLVSFRGDLLCD